MSAPMKKLPTDVEVNIYAGRAWRFIGPKRKLKLLLTLLPQFEFESVKPETAKPWREVAQKRIAQYGEPGLALRGARAKAGLSQEEFAKKLGIPQYEISKLESGKRSISKKMALQLARVLETDYRVFL